nr:response regulator [Cohnella sp. REN36]
MVVDDELIVRIGMKSVIDWEGNGFRYAGEASDGLEALAILDAVNPDILLTDIKMPNMNGIELIETVKRSKPGVRILVLSSHDEFDYVKNAMKLGADDYVLKASVDPDKLIRLLREAAGKLKPERHLESVSVAATSGGESRTQSAPQVLASEALMLRAIEGRLEPDERNLPSLAEAFSGRFAYVTVARIADDEAWTGNGHGDEWASSPAALETLVHVLELNARKWAQASSVKASEREVALVLWFTEQQPRDRFAEIGSDLAIAAARFAGATIEVGFGGHCREAGELARGYAQAVQALEGGFYGGGDRVFVFGIPEPVADAGVRLSLSKTQEKELALAVERLDERDIARLVGTFFANLKAMKPPVAQAIQACLDLYYALKGHFRKLGVSGEDPKFEVERPDYRAIIGFSKVSQAERWFDRYVSGSLQAVRSLSRDRGREEIQSLVAYMREHYAESFTLKQAATMTRMSEGYLSFVFKKETGTGFVEFLNELRIERAAQLLRDTHLPSYAIAERVGYDNINYFGRIFKKVKGMSPKRYRANYTIGSATSIPTE